jgi:hypothetical protein
MQTEAMSELHPQVKRILCSRLRAEKIALRTTGDALTPYGGLVPWAAFTRHTATPAGAEPDHLATGGLRAGRHEIGNSAGKLAVESRHLRDLQVALMIERDRDGIVDERLARDELDAKSPEAIGT